MKKWNMSAAVIIILVILAGVDASAFTDQATTERILRENRHFINFINVCVSNFDAAKRDLLKKVYSRHFNADVAYLQSDYRRAYKSVYSSQKDMVVLYEDVLKSHYLEASKNILDQLAPDIIRSKNPRARLYLTLGYRDRTVSWTHYTVAEASNPRMYSYKLYKYEDGIKMGRRAKRYGFLALFESQDLSSKRKIYNHMMKREKEKGRPFFNRFLDLKEDDYINEVGKTYEEYEKSVSADSSSDTKKAVEGKPYEKKIERRVRFRNEKRTARYMLNAEFDKAEDIMRKYIDDFNFKLILSTFEFLDTAATAPGSSGKKIDYASFKVHLYDNYLRLTGSSILDGLYRDVKVDDDIRSTDEKKSDDEGLRKETPLKDRDADLPADKGGEKTDSTGKK